MGTTTATDRIEKTVIINAPRSRVWQAIADTKQFGEWFRVKLDGDFKAGATIFVASTVLRANGFDSRLADVTGSKA